MSKDVVPVARMTSPVDGTGRPRSENKVTDPVSSLTMMMGLYPGEVVAFTKETTPLMAKGMPVANSSSERAFISAAVLSSNAWASAAGRSRQVRNVNSGFKAEIFYHIPRSQRD